GAVAKVILILVAVSLRKASAAASNPGSTAAPLITCISPANAGEGPPDSDGAVSAMDALSTAVPTQIRFGRRPIAILRRRAFLPRTTVCWKVQGATAWTLSP